MCDNEPAWLHLGRQQHKYWLRTDSAFMIFLLQMSYPARWCALMKILGGSITILSDTFNSMVRILYPKYHAILLHMGPWQHQFPAFAQHLVEWGCPHNNLVAIFDRHFQATCLPGGDANHSLTLHDRQTFAGKERLHGLKYQACVMPNSMCCVGGQWCSTKSLQS
jgi:hypothetical protein